MNHGPHCIPPDEIGAPGVCVCDEAEPCEHDFTFTENKEEGWCTKCRVDYDYKTHGIV